MSKLALFPENEMRIVLIGKTGVGKSSAANSILGGEACEVSSGMCSGTEKCDMKEGKKGNVKIQVTDTPGVCDTHRSLEEVHREICKSLALVAPGPHAVIMCLRCDQRFTEEEYQAYQQLKNLFGENLTRHMILLFNGKTARGPSPGFHKERAKSKNLDAVFKDLKSHEYVVLFDNTANWPDRIAQGNNLIDKVVDVYVQNGERYFTDDILNRFEETLKKESQQTGMSRNEIRKAAIEDNEVINRDLQQTLPKEEVKKKGRWCTIL